MCAYVILAMTILGRRIVMSREYILLNDAEEALQGCGASFITSQIFGMSELIFLLE